MISPRALCNCLFSVLFGILTGVVAFYAVMTIDYLARATTGLPALGAIGGLWAVLLGGITISACNRFVSSSPPDRAPHSVRHTDPLYSTEDGAE